MLGANYLRESSFTTPELNEYRSKYAEGSFLKHRGELCKVRSMDPFELDIYSDQDKRTQELWLTTYMLANTH